MEVVLAVASAVLLGSGVWLILRPRSFQVLTGLLLMSYAVNLFILRQWVGASHKVPVVREPGMADPASYPDPLHQALVLTAIVISFATTAVYLVLMMGSRGLTGTDHVDGREPNQ